MPIKARSPLVVPEKQYPDLWISNLEISGYPDSEVSVDIHFVPYNEETGEYDNRPENVVRVFLPNMFAVVGGNPKIAQALGAVLLAADDLYKQNYPAVPGEE